MGRAFISQNITKLNLGPLPKNTILAMGIAYVNDTDEMHITYELATPDSLNDMGEYNSISPIKTNAAVYLQEILSGVSGYIFPLAENGTVEVYNASFDPSVITNKESLCPIFNNLNIGTPISSAIALTAALVEICGSHDPDISYISANNLLEMYMNHGDDSWIIKAGKSRTTFVIPNATNWSCFNSITSGPSTRGYFCVLTSAAPFDTTTMDELLEASMPETHYWSLGKPILEAPKEICTIKVQATLKASDNIFDLDMWTDDLDAVLSDIYLECTVRGYLNQSENYIEVNVTDFYITQGNKNENLDLAQFVDTSQLANVTHIDILDAVLMPNDSTFDYQLEILDADMDSNAKPGYIKLDFDKLNGFKTRYEPYGPPQTDWNGIANEIWNDAITTSQISLQITTNDDTYYVNPEGTSSDGRYLYFNFNTTLLGSENIETIIFQDSIVGEEFEYQSPYLGSVLASAIMSTGLIGYNNDSPALLFDTSNIGDGGAARNITATVTVKNGATNANIPTAWATATWMSSTGQKSINNGGSTGVLTLTLLDVKNAQDIKFEAGASGFESKTVTVSVDATSTTLNTTILLVETANFEYAYDIMTPEEAENNPSFDFGYVPVGKHITSIGTAWGTITGSTATVGVTPEENAWYNSNTGDIRLNVQVGDIVMEGDTMAEIETDYNSITVDCPIKKATVSEITVTEGETIDKTEAWSKVLFRLVP